MTAVNPALAPALQDRYFSRIANVWSLPIPRSGSVSLSRAQPVTTGSQEIEGFDPSVDERWLVFDSNWGGAQQLCRMPLPAGDARYVYYINRSPNQRLGVRRVPANRMVLRVRGNRLYFSLGDPQSDVWTTEIVSQRE